MKKTFYDEPTQVQFIQIVDEDEEPIKRGGIAYQDYIICGCCGGIIPINEVDAILEYLNWVDFSEFICEG